MLFLHVLNLFFLYVFFISFLTSIVEYVVLLWLVSLVNFQALRHTINVWAARSLICYDK